MKPRSLRKILPLKGQFMKAVTGSLLGHAAEIKTAAVIACILAPAMAITTKGTASAAVQGPPTIRTKDDAHALGVRIGDCLKQHPDTVHPDVLTVSRAQQCAPGFPVFDAAKPPAAEQNIHAAIVTKKIAGWTNATVVVTGPNTTLGLPPKVTPTAATTPLARKVPLLETKACYWVAQGGYIISNGPISGGELTSLGHGNMCGYSYTTGENFDYGCFCSVSYRMGGFDSTYDQANWNYPYAVSWVDETKYVSIGPAGYTYLDYWRIYYNSAAQSWGWVS